MKNDDLRDKRQVVTAEIGGEMEIGKISGPRRFRMVGLKGEWQEYSRRDRKELWMASDIKMKMEPKD
ncbi:hypothetical protein BDN72DRAFT_846338, partial [Pluteus cervinus]